MEVIDRKFVFTAVNPCNGHYYTQANAVVFAAKDRAFLPALESYREACVKLNCDESHIESIDLLIDRVRTYQKTVEKRIPDTDLPCEIDRCIGGNL